MSSLNIKAATVAASALACALLVCTLAGCAPKATATVSSAAAESTASAPVAPATNTTSLIEGTVDEEAVDTYCLSCHLRTDLPGWNKENVDAAMVESMLPTLSNDDVQALANHFATIEPRAQDEGQH